MEELVFPNDVSLRKQLFDPETFAHPAKMQLHLQKYLIERYTKPGDTILDPMAGAGSVLIACLTGRNVICVELEQKFVEMQKANWLKLQQRGADDGFTLGSAMLLQGDARQLETLLKGQTDAIITSPPYEGTLARDRSAESSWDEEQMKKLSGGSIKIAKGLQAEAIITSPPYSETNPLSGGGAWQWIQKYKDEGRFTGTSHDPGQKWGKVKQSKEDYSPSCANIGSLPYGEVEAIVTSPPYSDSPVGGGLNTKPPREGSNDQCGRNPVSPSQIGAGKYDAVISSPPYAQTITQGGETKVYIDEFGHRQSCREGNIGYGKDAGNIGNLPYGEVAAIITSPPYEKTLCADSDGGTARVARLRKSGHDKVADRIEIADNWHMNRAGYGDISAVITSPPYAEAQSGGGIAKDGYKGSRPHSSNPDAVGSRSYMPETHGQTKGQIANLPYGDVSVVITSPPYAEAHGQKGLGVGDGDRADLRNYSYLKTDTEGQIGDLPYGEVSAIITSPPYEGSLEAGSRHTQGGIPARDKKLGQTGTYADLVMTSPPYEGSVSDDKESPLAGSDPNRYGRWKDGTARKTSYTQHDEPCKEVDAVITSPPYEGSIIDGNENFEALRTIRGDKASQKDKFRAVQFGAETTAYGNIVTIITSPPYENTVAKGDAGPLTHASHDPDFKDKRQGYASSANTENIGNLKSTSYLESMLLVYQQCHAVLKPGGWLILVVKNFIRNKQIVHLDADTLLLAEEAGFQYVETLQRKLTQHSFWRILYHKKYPEVPMIEHEDILVFKKEE